MEYLQQAAAVRIRTRPLAGRRSRPKTKAAACAAIHDRHDFLRQSFLPFMEQDEALVKGIRAKQVLFFHSLANLAKLYGFEPLDVTGKVYPLNIFLAHRHAEQMVQQADAGTALFIIETGKQPACLATVRTYDTGSTLYYLPVQPILCMLKNKATKQRAKLLLSACAYLYNVAGIPYYRDSNSYTFFLYDMIEEMTKEDEQSYTKADLQKMLRDCRNCQRDGDKVKQLFSQQTHLDDYQQRLENFSMRCEADREIYKLAGDIFDLYRAYPNKNILACIPDRLTDPDEEERTRPEQYISFVWKTDGWLFDNLCEYVNSEIQEYSAIDEPAAIQYFDQPQTAVNLDLAFETTLFALLVDLAYILNNAT